MKNETILKMITEEKIEELKQKLREEIMQEQTGKSNTNKAIVKFSKEASKDFGRPYIEGAWLYEDKIAIIDGIRLILTEFDQSLFDACIKSDMKQGQELKLNNLIPNKEGLKQVTINKQTLKLAIAEKQHDVELDFGYKKYFNPKLLLGLLNCFDDDVKIYDDGKALNPILIEDKKSVGIIMPMRK